MHMFVVSFGQLSYSEPPDWIEEEGRVELESLVGKWKALMILLSLMKWSYL